MSTTLNERSGLPGSVENDPRPEPAGFLLSHPGYRSTALLDRLRATEYSYLDAGGHVYLDYTGAGLPALRESALGKSDLHRFDGTDRASPACGPRIFQRAA
jgi:hypothetical protein